MGPARDRSDRIGRYEIVRRIASGGMGAVYLARLRGTAGFTRRVALKILHRHLSSDPAFVAMFLDEARLGARIHHPNVVDVLDVESIDGELVLAMEHVEGASLHELGKRAKELGHALPLEVKLRIVADALLGLHAAHELRDDAGNPLGLVHRDVSPHNILVGVDGISRIADFGIARAAGRSAQTTTGTVKGKLRYLAPEQITSRETIDRRVDVFSAGIVLWELVTGERLFGGASDGEILADVLHRNIVAPSTIADVPVAIDAVCVRALERDADRRFPTAAAFAEALEAATTLARPQEVAAAVSLLVREAEDEGGERTVTAPGPAATAETDVRDGTVETQKGTGSIDVLVTAVTPMAAPPASIALAPAPASTRPRERSARATTIAAFGAGLVVAGIVAWAAREHASTPAATASTALTQVASPPAEAASAPAQVASAPAEAAYAPTQVAPAAVEPPSEVPERAAPALQPKRLPVVKAAEKKKPAPARSAAPYIPPSL